jgi:hypothetical protein
MENNKITLNSTHMCVFLSCIRNNLDHEIFFLYIFIDCSPPTVTQSYDLHVYAYDLIEIESEFWRLIFRFISRAKIYYANNIN